MIFKNLVLVISGLIFYQVQKDHFWVLRVEAFNTSQEPHAFKNVDLGQVFQVYCLEDDENFIKQNCFINVKFFPNI